MPRLPPGADGAGTYAWPIYIQGGTATNPQFAYYPVPPHAAPVERTHKHRRRRPRGEDDDDEECACPECIRPPPPTAAMPAAGPIPVIPPQPTAFIPTQVFAPPPVASQSTTFIPYVVPSHCTVHCKGNSTSSGNSRDDKKESRKSSAGTSSYHPVASCDCFSCKARTMAIEMDRIKEERRRERDYRDAEEFFKIKDRVDREDREAEIEVEYRAAKMAAEGAGEEMHMPHRFMLGQERDAGYGWTIPITAYHPGCPTPITLQAVTAGGYHHSGWFDHLSEENIKLRCQKDHLKEKVQQERSLRNKEEATRQFLSTRLQDLDQDVQDLKKKVRSSGTGLSNQPQVVEVQVPLKKHHRSHGNKGSGAEGRNKVKGTSKEATASRHSSGATIKTKTTSSKHKQPHVCHDSACDDYDSCSDCSFECGMKDCRTCRPRGGRR
ncbi:hypothetical protein DRE_02733 [Drechslerella stenobrocha 248]|uniref:Uncharacterized protein n=1 Tax=Drechslerella stenobrocha 248 TaxID=1043628 RepID=W7HUG1_9PEZI|nr:hypothetical protein DRE_02733 [Drechslerella stenobrocha 248]